MAVALATRPRPPQAGSGGLKQAVRTIRQRPKAGENAWLSCAPAMTQSVTRGTNKRNSNDSAAKDETL